MPSSLSAGMAVLRALVRASLCAPCIAQRAGLPLVVVMAEIETINVARARRRRPALGPIDARCLRCEAPRRVYRLPHRPV